MKLINDHGDLRVDFALSEPELKEGLMLWMKDYTGPAVRSARRRPG